MQFLWKLTVFPKQKNYIFSSVKSAILLPFEKSLYCLLRRRQLDSHICPCIESYVLFC